MTSAKKRPYRTDWQSMDTCCLDVSLHNRYQEGLYLASTYEWINSRFKDCLVNLGDTLHRHNLRHRHPCMEQAHNEARKLGDEWLAKNEPCLSMLKIPYRIMRSDDWLADPDMEAVHEAIWEFYYTDCDFKAVVNRDIETFVARRTDLPASVVRNASLAYLLEETAADILLGKRGGVAHLYPGGRHECYGYLAANAEHIPEPLRGLENSAFKRLSPAKISLDPAQLLHLDLEQNRRYG